MNPSGDPRPDFSEVKDGFGFTGVSSITSVMRPDTIGDATTFSDNITFGFEVPESSTFTSLALPAIFAVPRGTTNRRRDP